MAHPDGYPFAETPIPVTDGPKGFSEFAAGYPGFRFCPYLADKDADGWRRSTSRVYMNQVLPGFLYVPVNIGKADSDAVREFFALVRDLPSVPAVNITQPHKSSAVLRELVGIEGHIDTLIRGDDGALAPYDLNSAAFMAWYTAEIGPVTGRSVIVLGVGGVGEPIAKKLAAERPADLLLVDVADRSGLAARLAARYESSLRSVLDGGPPSPVTVVNAAGKEGAADGAELWRLIGTTPADGVFVDLRPQLTIDIVDEARRHGWNAHTGHGMNAHNDHVLLQGIAARIPAAEAVGFEVFRRLVAAAS